ncbi:Endoplasmic reticulum metallopeptidase 1 [Rhynchospora pubera]|uniref:Endoplasmic reticulum metallopeptidase 1 n=1 Tax=Rhynchospora pubera TaxID=906938 RepID=A0AAV8C1F3_9POAL|nr:Endoplasmic reticulum metallopeptidase 1 [Rhynchospora pubera]
MALWTRSMEDRRAFRCLFCLAMLYGLASWLVYTVLHMRHVLPLGPDAPLDRFSEARAVDHVRQLTVGTGGRQEGSPGLELAAQYIKSQLEEIARNAGPSYRIEVEESLVSGSFSMYFLHHRVTLHYRNHKNVVMRISSNISEEHDSSFLVNGHYDSPLGSLGAGDCGSCVASMLELARLIVDSKWVPPQPIIFLFNGAEELFLLGSHGFITTHKWRDTIGAFIDIEASGSGGIDLVCQSGPSSWPTRVYAEVAQYPMANSVAQDFFGIIPGDTDYRIFAEDYGKIPGLDIIFVLGGYFYHTSFDTVENLIPGSIQGRGENLIRLIKEFSNSSVLLNEAKNSRKSGKFLESDERAVFFDYLTFFMVLYSKDLAVILHTLPLGILLLVPFYLTFPTTALGSFLGAIVDVLKGMLFHFSSLILAIILPVIAAVVRLLFTQYSMSWFAHPFLAFFMFVPCSLVGLLLPKKLWSIKEETYYWGAYGLYVVMTMVYAISGLSGGFLTYIMSLSMLLAWLCFSLCKRSFGPQSLRSLAGYVVPLIPCLVYSVYYGGFLTQFVIEKMGMMGSLPQPYGYFVPDVIIAAVIGLVTGWSVGPILPVTSQWLARSSIINFLLQITVVVLALASQLFPYSTSAPKRVVFQHTFVTADSSKIEESSYGFSVVDSNGLNFLFYNSPDASRWLLNNSILSFEDKYLSDRSSWVAIYPVSFLFTGSLKFPAKENEILEHYKIFPSLSILETVPLSEPGQRRIHLELHLGSLSQIWGTAINITGPLANWSFADSTLPEPQTVSGGPPSYICRLTGKSHENWTFWLEANGSESLHVDLAVLDQYLTTSASELKSLFPDWADVTAYSTFFSSYEF